MDSGEGPVSGPLAGASRGLEDAIARREAATREAAALWTDAAYRTVDMRVLRPLSTEGSRFASELALADSALAKALALLGAP